MALMCSAFRLGSSSPGGFSGPSFIRELMLVSRFQGSNQIDLN